MKLKHLIGLLLVTVSATAQLKLGNNGTTRNANSILEMEHTTKGMLLPRVSLTSTTSYSPLSATIVAGFMIYNTNASASAGSSSYPVNVGVVGVYWWDGSGWVATQVSTGLLKANNLSDLASASTARTNLNLVPGTDIQAYDADLTDLADGSLSGSKVGSGIDGGNITTGTIAAARVATLNQNTTGSAATLTTPRSIYGNNFDGSAALTQIIASTYGGTGNGFTKFTGPATSEKTFTLPNATATILTDNAAVTVAQGGTGAATASGARTNLGLVIGTDVLAPNGSAASLTSFPTLNQNTTGSAATWTTARSLWGNSVNGSADITSIIASTYGGTGNGFTKFSGPTTSEKTFTLPNASATILTSNALVTGAQGGTNNGFTEFTGPTTTTKTFTLPNATATILTSNAAVTVAQGGTGATDAATARTNLGVAIGTNVQAYDADLDDLADGTLSASKIGTGLNAANIADGTVTNTEFQYIGGLTSDAQTQINAKQATLVSGTNIKTINSNSLLGSGNIAISAGPTPIIGATSAVTGTTSGNIISVTIPGGTLSTTQPLTAKAWGAITGSSGSISFSSTLGGTTITSGAYTSYTSNANNWYFFVEIELTAISNTSVNAGLKVLLSDNSGTVRDTGIRTNGAVTVSDISSNRTFTITVALGNVSTNVNAGRYTIR